MPQDPIDVPQKETPQVSEPEPVKPEPSVAVSTNPLGAKLRDTPSIFNRKKSKEDAEEKEQANVLDKKEESFTEESLQGTWKRFSEERKDAGDTDKLILNRGLKKGEGNAVTITLASQLEVSFLEKMEVELVQFLRSELKNDHITLEREIMQGEETKKLYTNREIFDHMVKENPDLKDLKDRLGLDFDY